MLFSHVLASAIGDGGAFELIAEVNGSGVVEVKQRLNVNGGAVTHVFCSDSLHGIWRAKLAEAMGLSENWAPIAEPGGLHPIHAAEHGVEILHTHIQEMSMLRGCDTVWIETHTPCGYVGHRRPQWGIEHQVRDLLEVVSHVREESPSLTIVPLFLVSENELPRKRQWYLVREEAWHSR